MTKYRLVIFDLDGTIADTSPGILNSIRYTIRKMNLPEISLERMYSHVGPPMEESYNRNFGLIGDNLKKAVAYHKEYAIINGYKELTIYDGIIELLRTLKARGIRTAVATLKPYATAIRIFESFDLLNKFDVIVGANADIPMTKKQMLERCMSELSVLPKDTVVIGDSEYDAKGAFEANIDFLAVTYGFGFKPDEPIPYPYVETCDNVNEIKCFLLDS